MTVDHFRESVPRALAVNPVTAQLRSEGRSALWR